MAAIYINSLNEYKQNEFLDPSLCSNMIDFMQLKNVYQDDTYLYR